MHISVVINDMNGGGSERVCLSYIHRLAERGHAVDLVLLKFEGPRLLEIPESINLYCLDANFKRKTGNPCSIDVDKINWIAPPRLWGKIKSAARYFKEFHMKATERLPFRLRHCFWTVAMADYISNRKPEVIYANLVHAGVICIFARQLASQKIPIVWAVRNYLCNSLNDRDLRYFCQLAHQAEFLQAVSKGIADSISHLVPAAQSAKIRTIYNGLNPSIQKLASQDVNLLSEHFSAEPVNLAAGRVVPNAPRVILTAGRLSGQKNHRMLVRAFAEVRKKQDVILVMLGEGAGKLEILREAKQAGVAEFVLMPGWVQNPYAYMSRADVFVLSSNYEGLPNALIEALACGCPVVSTDCPHGPSEILENGRWGRLTPLGDHQAMARAIIATLEQSTDQERLRNRAADFSIENSVLSLEAMLAETVSKIQK